jgi:hypothetical protein
MNSLTIHLSNSFMGKDDRFPAITALVNSYRQVNSFQDANLLLELAAYYLPIGTEFNIEYSLELEGFEYGHTFKINHPTLRQETSNGQFDLLQHAEDTLNYELKNYRPMPRSHLRFLYWWKKRIKELRKQGLD